MLLFLFCNGALLARLAVGEFKCSKPSLDSLPSNATDVNFDRLFDILLIAVGFLHIPEITYLLVYLSRFIVVYTTWRDLQENDLFIKMKKFVESKKTKSVTFTLIQVTFILVALTLPAVCIYRSHILDQEPSDEICSELLNSVLIHLDHVYHGLSFITNNIIVLARYVMIFFTVMIGVIWKRERPSDQNNRIGAGEQLTQEQLLNDLDNVHKIHKPCLDDYEKRIKHVRPIYKIFQSFFVLQWIIHLFGLFFHIAHLIRPWIRRGQIANAGMLIITHQIYEFLYIIFDGLALITTRLCTENECILETIHSKGPERTTSRSKDFLAI